MKQIFGILLIIISVLGGLYVGGWLMFVQPIIEVCKAIDTGTLTAMIVGGAVIKCFLASPVGVLIGYIGTFIGTRFLE